MLVNNSCFDIYPFKFSIYFFKDPSSICGTIGFCQGMDTQQMITALTKMVIKIKMVSSDTLNIYIGIKYDKYFRFCKHHMTARSFQDFNN